MIPILYDIKERDFTTYGIGALVDAVAASATEELNGEYEAVLRYPCSGRYYGDITTDSIIKMKANNTDGPQLFRVYRISKPINGVVDYSLEHISYELAKAPVEGFKGLYSLAQFADELQIHSLEALPYTITGASSVRYTMEIAHGTSIRAALRYAADLFGAEMHFDNRHVHISMSRGEDKGDRITYGVNLADLRDELDSSELYTSIHPFAKNGEDIVSGGIVDIAAMDDIGYRRIMVIDFSSEFSADDPPTYQALVELAQDYGMMSDEFGYQHSVDAEIVPRDCDDIALGDTVTITDKPVGVSLREKVVKTEYDGIAERYTSMVIGRLKRSTEDILVHAGGSESESGSEGADDPAVTAMTIRENELIFDYADGTSEPIMITRDEQKRITSMDGMAVNWQYGTV